MTDLTDEQRLAEAVAELEREHRISDGDGLCHWCGDPPPCPTLRVILELRELRAERKNFDSALEEQMRRGDEYWAENERLRAALSSAEKYATGGILPDQTLWESWRAALASVTGGDA